MTRQLLSFVSVLCLLALLPASDASALDLPVRKAGLWEMKVLRTGSPAPDMTMQHCTDESTDKEMSSAFSPMGKEMCSKQDIQKTATGYVSDSVWRHRRDVDHLARRDHWRLQFGLHGEIDRAL
jgi:hypothetical protein